MAEKYLNAYHKASEQLKRLKIAQKFFVEYIEKKGLQKDLEHFICTGVIKSPENSEVK